MNNKAISSHFYNLGFYFTTVFLGILSAKWIWAGFEFLIFSQQPGEPRDLLAHWTEQQHVNQNINPYQLEVSALDLTQWKIGAAHFPWMRSFIAGGLLYSPDWPWVRYYYAFIELIAILAIAWCVWDLMKGYKIQPKIILVLSVTACSSIFTNLWVGQIAIILVSVLLLILRFHRNRSYFPISGLLLGFSLVKPTLTAYFFPAVLIGGYWKIAGVALLYVIAATIDVLARTQTGLWEWMSLVLKSGEELSTEGFSLLNFAIPLFNAFGLGEKAALLVVFMLVSIISLILMFVYRHSSLMLLFSIAAVAGRLATYHRSYDDFIIIFLLLPLGQLAFKYPRKIYWLGFVLVGLSLWGPIRLNSNWAYNVFQLISWIVGLGILIASCQKLENQNLEQGSKLQYSSASSDIPQVDKKNIGEG